MIPYLQMREVNVQLINDPPHTKAKIHQTEVERSHYLLTITILQRNGKHSKGFLKFFW